MRGAYSSFYQKASNVYRGNPRLAKLVILGAFSGSVLVTYYQECNKEDFFLGMRKIKDGTCQVLNLELAFKLLCDSVVRCVCYISAANVHLMLLRNVSLILLRTARIKAMSH
ncbi:hypothetical protein Tco_1462177 [Tanacetum coccineum]